MLLDTVINRLYSTREMSLHENGSDFRSSRKSVEQVFTFQQIVEHNHMSCVLKISVFLELKAAFDSVDHTVLWCRLSLKDVPGKCTSLTQSPYTKN